MFAVYIYTTTFQGSEYIKKCSKCGIEKDESEFYNDKTHNDGKTSQCKECKNKCIKRYCNENKEKVAERQKKWRENNKEKIIKHYKEYRENNKEKIREHSKKYEESHREYIRQYNKQYRTKNKDELAKKKKEWVENNKDQNIEQKKEWYKKNKMHVNEKNKCWREENKEQMTKYFKNIYEKNKERIKVRIKLYRKTSKGREVKIKSDSKRRKLGHDPINSWFKGSEAHHLRYSKNIEEPDNNLTIYAPRKLHHSIWHNGNTGQGMKSINMLLLEWYFETTPDEERNPKAVKLYWNYCTLPEPEWGSNQNTMSSTPPPL